MRTEEQLVYQLLHKVHGGELSNDNPYSERLMRAFLRKHRASHISKFYQKGWTVEDVVFQSLGPLEFKQVSGREFQTELPAIINMEHNFGLYLEKNYYNIPVLRSYDYRLSMSNILNKDNPKSYFQNKQLTLFIGNPDSCNALSSSPKELAVEAFNKEFAETDDEPKVIANVFAVLYDPEQGLNYDWTKDPYPCPSEIIDKIDTSTMARDLNMMIRMEPDLVGNSKPDQVQFDDTKQVL